MLVNYSEVTLEYLLDYDSAGVWINTSAQTGQ